MSKKKVRGGKIHWSKPYKNLKPVVEFLLENGNSVTTPEMFLSTPDGYKCYLKNPIAFELLYSHFEFPDTVILNEENDRIGDRANWVVVYGGSAQV